MRRGGGGGRGNHHRPSAPPSLPSATFLAALAEQRAREAARAAAAPPANAAPPRAPPAPPLGMYYDSSRNRHFRLRRDAPPELLARARADLAPLAAAPAQPFRLAATGGSLCSALRARETAAVAPWAWEAATVRAHVAAWRSTHPSHWPVGGRGVAHVAVDTISGAVVCAEDTRLWLAGSAQALMAEVGEGQRSPVLAVAVRPTSQRLLVATSRMGLETLAYRPSIELHSCDRDSAGQPVSARPATLCLQHSELGSYTYVLAWRSSCTLALGGASGEAAAQVCHVGPEGLRVTAQLPSSVDVFALGAVPVAHAGGSGESAPLLLGRRDGSVLLWDPRATPAAARAELRMASSVVSLGALGCASPAGVLLADASETLELRDVRSLSRRMHVAAGYRNSTRRLGVAIGAGGALLAAACADGVVRCWDSSGRGLVFQDAGSSGEEDARPRTLAFVPSVGDGQSGAAWPALVVGSRKGVRILRN